MHYYVSALSYDELGTYIDDENYLLVKTSLL